MRHALLLHGAAVFAIGLCVAQSAAAQQRTLGTFSDWTAVVDGAGSQKVCYMGSVPKKAEGNYTRRGDTHVMVTHRPADKVRGEVSVTAGYSYKPGSDVEAVIDGRTFKLFTRDGHAWAQDAAADRAMVAAMKAGLQMVVRGTSTRGTLTTDTYSLNGFTSAYEAIDRACE